MPTTIPFDPSLVLGNLITEDALTNLTSMATVQAGVDAAEEHMNSLITARRKLDMSIQEFIDMGISPTDEIVKARTDLNTKLASSLADYTTQQATAEDKLAPLRAKITGLSVDVESPIDYVRTQIKKMPLSADSLKLDAQYFSMDENQQQSNSQVATIKSYVSESTSFLGSEYSSQIAGAAEAQASSQYENHEVAGTLVITAGCTHKDAVLLAPFILDVDKAIRVWNDMFASDQIKIDVATLQELSQGKGTISKQKLRLLSGATYGSSFVGMVHVLRTESTAANQSMVSVASSLQEQFQVGGWFASESGGFGVDASFSDDIKNLISSQNISSHISLITMGSIPSIKSNQVQIGVKEFANFDPAQMMSKLAALNNATTADKSSVAESATAARTGAQMLSIQGSTVTNVMSGLDKIDDGANKMLDINSLMTAFEDYVDKALSGNVGVPINYYLKSITAVQLAEMWVAKYYPNKYLAISGDDSGNGGGTAPAK